jgi:hypothetical protein
VWRWSPTLGKVGDLESSGTPECLEIDSKGQNTLHWGVLGVIGKVLKRRYRKCPRIGNSDIFGPSYGQKILTRDTTLVQTSSQSNSTVGSYDGSKFQESRRDNFGTPFRESREFVPFGCSLHGELQRIL